MVKYEAEILVVVRFETDKELTADQISSLDISTNELSFEDCEGKDYVYYGKEDIDDSEGTYSEMYTELKEIKEIKG